MTASTQQTETSSRRFWLAIILLLMAINFGVAIVATVVAVGDVSLRAMPDYGEQAVSWQTRKEILAQSKALGWNWKLDRDPASSDSLVITLADRELKPVEDCSGTLQAYHFTAAGEVFTYPLSELNGGQYRVEGTMRKPGLWRLLLELKQPSGQPFMVDEVWCLNASDQFEREPDSR